MNSFDKRYYHTLLDILETKKQDKAGLTFKITKGKHFVSEGELYMLRVRRFKLNKEIKALETKIKSYAKPSN